MGRAKSIPTRKLLTKAELAEAWGCGKSRIEALIASGELSAINLSGPDAPRPQIRILREDADAFIERRRVKATGDGKSPTQHRPKSDPNVKQFV